MAPHIPHVEPQPPVRQHTHRPLHGHEHAPAVRLAQRFHLQQRPADIGPRYPALPWRSWMYSIKKARPLFHCGQLACGAISEPDHRGTREKAVTDHPVMRLKK